MQKLNFFFSSISFSRFQRNKRNVKRLTQQSVKCLMAKAAAIISLAAASHLPAAAQTCNTFVNADAANPILSVLPAGTYVYAVNFVDIDGDGDLDCYVSTNDSYTPILYLNKGNAHHPVYEKSAKNGFTKNDFFYSDEYIQFVDIDGDGDMDCFASDVEVGGYYYERIHFYQNTGTPQKPVFVENQAANPVANVRAGNYVAFKFADIDGDGDLDFYYYDHSPYFSQPGFDAIIANTGTKTNPAFTKYVSYEKNPAYRKDRVYYDWNKDGLLDYFTSIKYYASVFKDVDTRYYRNIGPENRPDYVNDTLNRPDFKNGGPYQIVDLNGDGAPEVFTFDGHYSTLAPVAVISDTTITQNGVASRVLYSTNRSSAYQYQWELNGKKIAGADGFSLKITCAGTYTLYVKNACGIGVSLNYVVTGNSLVTQNKTSGLLNLSLSPVIVKAYPNPFVDEFTVQLPSLQTKQSTIRITDLAGRILLSQTTSAGTVKMGNTLPKGMYLLQVIQNNKVVHITKIAKQ